jgi:hypothetical protein
MKMKTVQAMLTVAAFGLGLPVHGALNLSFTQTGYYSGAPFSPASGINASGTIDVSGNQALSGSLTISGGPDAGNYTLFSGSGNNFNFTWDSLVYPGNNLPNPNALNPPEYSFLTGNGLLFYNNSNPGEEVNLFYNQGNGWGPDNSYTLLGVPSVGYPYNMTPFGNASLVSSAAVPEPTTIASAVLLTLLPLGAGVRRFLRKK